MVFVALQNLVSFYIAVFRAEIFSHRKNLTSLTDTVLVQCIEKRLTFLNSI